MKKILICAACVLAWFSSSALAQERPPVTGVNLTVEGLDIIMSWTAFPGATAYTVRTSLYPGFTPRRYNGHTASTSFTLNPVGLNICERYYFRVEAHDDRGNLLAVSTPVSLIIPGGGTCTCTGTGTPPPPEPTPDPPPPEPTPPEPDPEPTPPPVAPPVQLTRHTRIYFANGVGNSGWDALLSMERLQKEYDPPFNKDPSMNYPYRGTYSFRMAYNPTEGVVWDILSEVVVQKWKETTILAANPDVQELEGYLLRRTLKYWIRKARGGNPEAPQQLRNLLKRIKPPLNNATINAFTPTVLRQLTTAFNQRFSTIIPGDGSRLGTAAKHAVKYETELRKGNRVFVVSHSQGNLFANVALEAVALALPACRFSLSQIGVATPANRQFERDYTTGTDDLVINLLRPIYTVLPATVTNGPRSGFWSFLDQNHAFVEEYMKRDHKSFADIDWDMKTRAIFAKFPEPYPPPSC